MAKKVESIKHKTDTRTHIPSKEEAGYEYASEKVSAGKKILELPKNPVVHRGQDPELFWLNKYGNDDRDDLLSVDIRSLYRHEHIAPETLIKNLYKLVSGEWHVDTKTGNKVFRPTQQTPISEQLDLFGNVNQLFGNALDKDELEKVSEYYQHQDGWTNRLIQGDSHLVMASLLEREGMAGQVQTIYIDPPYGIKYGGNWQVKLNNRDVKDGSDEALTAEPEQIKAFRDTWELGIHSYLSYLRDRLLIAKELLTDSGSCFVQISDENVHLVRCLMDEVFGSENFYAQINFKSMSPLSQSGIASVYDYIIWYAKDKSKVKFRSLYKDQDISDDKEHRFLDDHTTELGYRKITEDEFSKLNKDELKKIFRRSVLTSSGFTPSCMFDFTFKRNICKPFGNKSWRTTKEGIEKLIKKNRIFLLGKSPYFKQYHSDFPLIQLDNSWSDTAFAQGRDYIVQTGPKVIQRCLLMTTDPGDLVLDPTCGSGTTAYVAEQWGRRWITIDTSRIALNIAKQRLMTAVFPYYLLYDSEEGQAFLKKKSPLTHSLLTNPSHDIRQGFVYKTVPHITLKSLANEEPPATETLYDQPEPDNKRLRVSGPFTVETLQNYEPMSPEELDQTNHFSSMTNDIEQFEEVIKGHLISAGIKNGRKDEMVLFKPDIRSLSSEVLHLEGFYQTAKGEEKAYFHIGPKFGTVSKKLVSDAVKECRQKGDANWLVILGFSFESDIEGGTHTTSMGNFEVTKVRMHDDLLQEGLKKKPAKSAASFVTIGEPDVEIFSEEFLVFSETQTENPELKTNHQQLKTENQRLKIFLNYGEIKKLSGLNSLAEINGLSQADLYLYAILSEGRDVWHYLANEEGFNLYSGQYSRGAGTELNGGIPMVSWNSPRFSSRVGNISDTLGEFGLSSERDLREFVEKLRGDKQIISRIEKIATKLNLQLPTKNEALKTKNYSLTTIKGLDIYDPIKDEVKARNLHEIAYWMLDDDYDGSNFVVKQVFFCGGDKSEFDKWRKGLDTLARDNTKKKVEKTLKIVIDDEAFDRLYGHTSHPIEVKSKGQKIAVRIVSQFGEECTKVLSTH